MSRGFEVVSKYIGEDGSTNIKIPERKTQKSAGYDLAAAKEVFIYPKVMVVVPTGIKAFMEDNEYLDLRVRSGLSIKNNVSLINGGGVIDADYYNNEDNEGEILVGLINHGLYPVTINKGDRVAQAIFTPYLKVDNDEASGKRVGGFGSTETKEEYIDTPIIDPLITHISTSTQDIVTPLSNAKLEITEDKPKRKRIQQKPEVADEV
jgi:dUTP pyrophosphatase